ncbi:MAG: pyridoxamine 5'-phosphate oxidase family protein [Candidatus Cloacimonetes bacterium]|nr:pyridoxamine 5'-phosphate oxidase family protein [Candidatus Cloacimonadota bacterium]MCF7814743.1 pyridoxamine 5'-phosphate oxidase family protein [Candidatus Cloacimonadota bacterium]MCF7868011.1 pyridoxamine 5'-phosphate oxidase family protein [Candidatus Cloacimonadota bacterium]MCF7883469.1 pyridoxamine 5'-phosphate oxidase family protein [Candidatus Cloacimonadota bacterium]
MRRKDREIKDKKEIIDIIERSEECYLAMSVNDQPYVIPVNFGFQDETIYIHCAAEGKKIEMIKQNPNVSLAFTAEAETSLTGPPNTWTTFYQSAIASGKAELVLDVNERQKGMNAFQKHYTGRFMDFSERDLKKIMLIRVKITEMTGKANLPKDEK